MFRETLTGVLAPAVHEVAPLRHRVGRALRVGANGVFLTTSLCRALRRITQTPGVADFSTAVRDSRSTVVPFPAGTLLPEEGWRGREIFGLAKEESRVKGLGNGYF